MSLVELTMAVVVFGIFGIFVTTTVLQATRLSRDSSVRELTAQRASAVMAQVTRDLRTATRVGPTSGTAVAFVSAGPTEIVFHSGVEPAPVLERLRLTAGGLFRETKLPDAGTSYPDLRYTSTDPTRTRTRRLASTGLSTTGVFTYTVLGNPSPTTSVDPAAVKDITAITVRISLDGDGPGRLAPVVLENTVRPYNS